MSTRLPTGWTISRLGDLATAIQYGYTEKAQLEKVGPRFLRITDIQDDAVNWSEVPFCVIDDEGKEKYLLRHGDLVFARTGATVGKSFLITGSIPESVFASYLIRVRLRPDIEPKYVSYFFRSSDYWRQISESQAGIGQPNVNGKKLAQIQIPVAPLDQQKRIVAEIEKQFSRLDEAVANLKRAKANLKRYKAAVLKAAVEGRLVESLNGPILRKSLKSLGDWCGGGTPSKSRSEYWIGGKIPWVSPKDMKTDVISDAEDHITEAAIKGSATNLVSKGAVLVVTRSGILRHTLPVAITTESVAINQDLKALRPSDGYDPEFIALALRAQEQEILHQCSKEGTTVQSIEFPQFLRYEIPVPTLVDQRLIVTEVERRLSLVRETEAQVDANTKRAERLRLSLLASAFSGKLGHLDTRKIGGVHG